MSPNTARTARVFLLTVCLLTRIAGLLWAQGAGASIVGTVKDEQGGVVPGASMTLRNQDTGLTRTAVTDLNGRYLFTALPLGRYSVRTELSGFAPSAVNDLALTIGLELRHDFTMKLQGLVETVTVSGDASVVEVTKSD